MLLRHVAEAIARDLGVTIRTVNSRDVARAGDLATILTSVQAGDVVYMDDVNALAPPLRSVLRDAMVEFAVNVGIGMGSPARPLRMTCQRFTLVGGVPSRRALTSEAASYFVEHIDGRSLDSAWTAAVARVRAGATTSTSVEPTTQGRGEIWAADDGEAENEDRLLAEAGKLVREYQRASVSLLQRRLSIGYSRAARLLDQLEKRGIVGPSEDGRSRVVLDLENDRAERDQAQERTGCTDPEPDAAWTRAARAEAERDAAQARAHTEQRGWLARLLRRI
jgi:hypothetical protein